MDELAAECTAIEAFQYCGPNIIFASGSPFRDVDLGQISLNLILSIPYKVHLMFLVNSARICLTWLAWRTSIGPLAVPHHRSGSILGLSLLDDSEQVDLEYSPLSPLAPCLFESESSCDEIQEMEKLGIQIKATTCTSSLGTVSYQSCKACLIILSSLVVNLKAWSCDINYSSLQSLSCRILDTDHFLWGEWSQKLHLPCMVN